MTAITGLTQAGSIRTAGRTRSGTAGFHVPEDAPADAPAAVTAVALPSFLALQELDTDTVQDRDARRHGKAMLDALTRLQRLMLSGGGTEALESLANLLRAAPTPSDPRLAAVHRAVLVRAAVEVARGRAAVAGASYEASR